jgi:phosphoesterase RecJ-like protein
VSAEVAALARNHGEEQGTGIDLDSLGSAVPAAVVERIASARSVLAVCHENPEADALGAALGVSLIVEARGGSATPVCADPVPPMYAFLPGMERFRTEPDPEREYDLVVVVDCGELARVGPILERYAGLFGRVPIVNIDHHLSNPGFGAVDWIDPLASATCEMVPLLASRLGVPLDAADGTLATVLMAGLVMDTATFQHPNVTPRTLAVAGALRDAGAPLSEISRRIYRTKPNRQLCMFGRVLARLESSPDGRVVWSTLEPADVESCGALESDSEGLIDLLSQSETAEVALLFKDQGPVTRVSVRTRPGGVDATVLTGLFGGGGHARAAGATVSSPAPEARQVVLAEAARLAAGVDRRPTGAAR